VILDPVLVGKVLLTGLAFPALVIAFRMILRAFGEEEKSSERSEELEARCSGQS